MKKLATIAARVGVSQMTVSRALNNKPGVKAETREKICQVAKEVGYRPNPRLATLMASLRSRRKKLSYEIMAFVTTFSEEFEWKKNPLFLSYFEGAAERASTLGYQLEHFWVNDDKMPGRRLSHILYSRSISGLIVAPLPVGTPTIDLDWSKFASVSFGHSLRSPAIHRIQNDQHKMMDIALTHIRQYGYRRIGFVIGTDDDKRVEYAWRARYLLDRDLYTKPRDVLPLFMAPNLWTPDMKALLPTFKTWLQKHKPEVVLTINPAVASWIVQAGFRVPRDFAFVSMDVTDSNRGKIAGIDQQSRFHSHAAVDVVVGQHHRNEIGLPVKPQTILLSGIWTDGLTLPVRS